jgi:hypothetical protein
MTNRRRQKEVPRVNAEEEVDRAPSSGLLEGLVESFVPRIGRTPNLVFERLLHVIFGVRFNYKVTSLKRKKVRKKMSEDSLRKRRTNAGRVSKFWGL